MPVSYFPQGSPVTYKDDAAPTSVSDKSTLGVRPGYTWADETTRRWYVCRDSATGAAQWDQLTYFFSVDSFGAKGDGVTDDAAVIQLAIDTCFTAGGGVVLLGPKRYLIGAAGLTIKRGVTLAGEWHSPDEIQGTDYTVARYALITNSAGRITMQWNTGLKRLWVMRSGLTKPTTVRQHQDVVAAFAGVGVFIQGSGARIEDVIVLGYQTGIQIGVGVANSERATLNRVFIDATNGVDIDNCHDIVRLYAVHAWSFVTTHQAANFAGYSVSAIADNGSGKLRLTIAAHPFITGDRVNVILGGGFRRRATLTVINSTTVDLLDHNYSASYTTPGAAVYHVSNYRDGIGFRIRNSEAPSLHDCFSYGHEIGYDINTAAGWAQLFGCSYDNLVTAAVDDAVGFWIRGSSYGTNIVGGITSSCGKAAIIDSTGTSAHMFTAVKLQTYNGSPEVIRVVNGFVTFAGCSCPHSGGFIADAAADRVIVSGCDFPSLTVTNNASTRFLADTSTFWANRSNVFGAIGGLRLGTLDGTSTTPFIIEGFSSGDGNQGCQMAFRNGNGTTGTWAYMRVQTNGTIQYLNGSYAFSASLSQTGLWTCNSLSVTGTATISGVMTLSSELLCNGGNIRLGAAADDPRMLSGSGSPESVVSASTGSLFFRKDGSPGTLLYLKESSPTPTTGWIAKW